MIKKYFGYEDKEELAEKMTQNHVKRDSYCHYSVDTLDFGKILDGALESKNRLLKSINVESKFDEKGRFFIKLKDFEDEGYKERQFDIFRSGLDFKERILLSNFKKEDLLKGRLSEHVFVGSINKEFNEGEKAGRVLRKAFKALHDGDAAKAEAIVQKYSLINNESVNGYLVLSVNPLDFLSMSWGQSWGSCLDAGGEYETGTLAWALDEYSLLTFLISESDYDKLNEDEYVEKKWRKVLVWDSDYTNLLGNRGYPYCGENLTTESVLSLFPFTFQSNDSSKIVNRIAVRQLGQCYNDVSSGNKIMLFSNTDIESFTNLKENRPKFYLGKAVPCLECNSGIEALSEGFTGSCCSPFEECEFCGEMWDSSEMYYVEDADCSVCEDCLDNSFVFSEEEGEHILLDNAVYCENISDYVHKENPKLTFCSVCNEGIFNSTNVDDLCEDCLEERQEG